ncbi:unnamed protein product [Lota lota]
MRSSCCSGFEKNPGTAARARILNLQKAHLSLVSIRGHYISGPYRLRSTALICGCCRQGHRCGCWQRTHFQGPEIDGNEMESTVADVQPGR